LQFLDKFVAVQPLPLIAILLFSLLVAGELIGSQLRKRLQRKNDNLRSEAAGIDYILTSVFALLGLLIAFTFGLALDRYETRRDLVVQEANAIGTAVIRSAFAQEPAGPELRSQLQTYASVRLAYGNARFEDRPKLAATSAILRSKLALVGVAASQRVSSPPLAPALISSVNEVIDVGSEREAINLARVPASVIFMLLGYAIISAFILGYSQANASMTQRVANKTLFILLTFALATIFDLDRPSTGTIKVSQQPMADLIAGF
jgi:hypothetical protein